ncbi:spermidine synthase [Micromonospora craniellae]|uniref:Spermine synthase n=1 Tax=Micromonospora craniellae TaxID=2294034 RepID=A0A372G3F0_9ACTN|nr:fused MFS/spermidine synthase [Micromonospora craniellae]QOC92119.1 fused MFS/spermidine synthase [Micromonospora craniellae]RFS47424.1 spermine synthase [Micromonospora craniellae]
MEATDDRLELVVDPARPTGRTLLAGGVEQSYVVTRDLPLRQPGVEIRVDDARQAVTETSADAYDLVFADIYRAARMPPHVATVAFAAEVARVLRPDGVYLVNVTDLPPLLLARVQAATLRAVFADVCVVADRRMLRGRRYGNLVLAAATRPGRLPVTRLTQRVRRDPLPGAVLHGPTLDAFVGGVRPRTDDAGH